MKLVHPDYSFQIEFTEGNATELIIEEPHLFSDFIYELIQQLDGNEGRFVLAHENELIKLSQRIDCVINPFGLDINQKKVINKLYQLIKEEVMCSELMIQLGDAYGVLVDMMNRIQEYIDYPLSFKDEVDVVALLKYMDVKLVNIEGDLVEQIIDYSKFLHQLLRQDIMILVNIQSYLQEQEIQALLKHSAYEKVHFLFIENVDRELIREGIRRIVVDKDRCEIF